MNLFQVELPSLLVQTALDIAQCFQESGSDVYHLPDNLGIQTLIPLAGLLLEYPVVYIPTSDDQSVFLPGVALDVYQCIMSLDCMHGLEKHKGLKGHPLLKFSCPASFGETKCSFAPSNMKAYVEALFRARLHSIEDSWFLEITHSIITLDRVAL